MAQRRQALQVKSEPSLSSLANDTVSLLQKAMLRPFVVLFQSFKSLVRITAPPLIPFAILVISTPILALVSFATGFYVWKSGSVSWLSQLDLQYGDGQPPYATTTLPMMSAAEPYDILLHLVLPATQANYDIGNFMTSLSLMTVQNKTITNVRKPAILLQPRSILFSNPKTTRLTVRLLVNHIMTASRINANVELGRKDGWKSLGSGEGREVSVLSAALEGVLKYHGIRGMVSKYPITAGIISGWSFFIVSFLTMSLCLAPAITWRYDIPTEEFASDVKTESPPGASVRRRKSLKREPAGKTVEVKTEEPSASSPGGRQSPLRRRRSQLSRDED